LVHSVCYTNELDPSFVKFPPVIQHVLHGTQKNKSLTLAIAPKWFPHLPAADNGAAVVANRWQRRPSEASLLWTSADRSRRGVLAPGESRVVVAFAAAVVAVTALAVAVTALAVAVIVGAAVACDKGIPWLMLSPCCWQQRGKAGTTTGD
jgi:hypothetical protein